MSFWGWLAGTDKYGAAQSAFIAKYTFTQLTDGARNLSNQQRSGYWQQVDIHKMR
jgi:hypothetical protein